MAAYTINTSNAQEIAIDYLFARENLARQRQGQNQITRNQFVNGMFDKLFNDAVNQAKSVRMSERYNALQQANQATLDQIDSTLGI